MSKRDYYEVLGVSRTVTTVELKKAYRRKAMKYHPDRNPGDEEAEARFKECKEAYEMLSDPQKKAAYDQFGHAGVDPSMGGAGAGGAAGGFGDMFGDIFGDIFGGGGAQGGRARRGSDLQYNLEISLEDAVRGTEVEIRVPSMQTCDTCHGNGAEPGSSPVTCTTCNGHGQVRIQQGFFSVQQTCPQCRGRGQIIEKPCKECHGQGRVQKHKTLSVKIPAGIDHGDRIRLHGEGEAGPNGAPAGDLYVQAHILPHDIFQREGDDLYCEMPVSYATVALGGELEVPTLGGTANLKIPAESQTGKTFRLRGKGVTNVRHGQTGDLYCKIIVETPVNLTKEQKDVLKKFDQSLQDNGARHSPKESSFTDKIKSFFEDLVG